MPFQTPDQVSAHEVPAHDPFAPLGGSVPTIPEKPVRGTGRHWFNIPWPPSKHEIILIAAVLAMAIFGVVGFLLLNKSDPAPVTVTKPVKKVAVQKPTTVPSTLSGLQVAPEVNQRPVVGVMIENSQAARPQSGLSEAGVVFEAIAEGGITRLLALYQDKQPGNIGPIRSARPYYVQWSEGFRAAYAHVGGSPEALTNIRSWGVQDMDQFHNADAFRREKSRPSPHNVYSNVADLAALAGQKGYKSEFTGFARKKASPAPQPTASTIDMTISSRLYNSMFTYDAATNTYLRSMGGSAHIDANTNKQLAPNVVIALIVPLSSGGRTSQGGSYSNYNPIGSGQAYVFQDGSVTIGNWHKADNRSQITFTDGAGAPLALNPGQTWLTALAGSNKLTYR